MKYSYYSSRYKYLYSLLGNSKAGSCGRHVYLPSLSIHGLFHIFQPSYEKWDHWTVLGKLALSRINVCQFPAKACNSQPVP